LSEELFVAIQADNHVEVSRLLDSGADVNFKNLAVKKAVELDSIEMLLFLVKHGAVIPKSGVEAVRLLNKVFGTTDNTNQILEYLLNEGVDINAVDDDGQTILKLLFALHPSIDNMTNHQENMILRLSRATRVQARADKLIEESMTSSGVMSVVMSYLTPIELTSFTSVAKNISFFNQRRLPEQMQEDSCEPDQKRQKTC